MKIALDYDNTYSVDPKFWIGFINLCWQFGHDVRVVTIRDQRFDRTDPVIEVEKIIPVIYTGGVAKKWYCQHFAEGFVPDVWIDDKPETILENSKSTPEFLVEWRANRDH